ncbi:Glucoamylase (glucan-1,4-alpha-glucosidase), GH15 family [Raineyella antarctica]|uniref:Glucoamylase (Glucan-1,4-alpha-glucosidase), GH15 family n=1 Tax=Raineyella antarctica TaxID=1577474 RepID=A0A1G6HFF2_9ACTN|nr:glycoside hydrolase family 15 protein [Raineyella antarctica]SDB92969.1 Glucoamylase (glucan-1,4-alpha-glucosidase), GH15 family [Raineyella antarctica]
MGDLADEFPPHVLREYAMLADGERAALLGPRGDIAWMCVPQWHDDAVFATLLGGRGSFAVTPADPRYVWGGRYEDGTLVWISRWTTGSGIIESREALARPGDPHHAVVLRRIRAVLGPAVVRVVLDVRAGFGHHAMTRIHRRDDGTWTARSGPLRVRFTGGDSAEVHDGVLELELRVPEGEHHDLVLELSDEKLPDQSVDPGQAWSATEFAWRRDVPRFDNTIAADDSRQSYAVLRGMTGGGGAMVAAATMGLPERAEQKRNYDYRYAWIRDQCFTGVAVAACKEFPLLDDAVRFVSARLLEDGPGLRPAYTVDGGRVPDERDVGLPGYPGGSGKAGNWANQQFQLDVFGEALLLFSAAAENDRLDLEQWKAVEVAADAIAQRHGEPDAGMWELNDDRWAHSRLICAAGLRAIGRHAPGRQGALWSSQADTLIADVTTDCLHPTGRWQRAPDDERVDASLLRPVLRGALAPQDPRSVATLEAIRKDLSSKGYLYRFRQDDRPLDRSEGAFLLCGFDLAMALHQSDQPLEAARWFERNRAACGSPGLFTEEYDVEQRQLRGNFPQGFVHAAMLESARRLAEPPPPWGGLHA